MDFVTVVVGIVILAVVVRRISRRGERRPDSQRWHSPPREPTDADVQEFLAQGKKIQAIKAYRVVHRVDLMEAKEAVEALARSSGLSR